MKKFEPITLNLVSIKELFPYRSVLQRSKKRESVGGKLVEYSVNDKDFVRLQNTALSCHEKKKGNNRLAAN